MIITRTPFRISFFGGGSDYPSYYHEHGGKVLGATIDKYCWLTVRRTPLFGKRFKIVYAKTEEWAYVDNIQHPAVRETLKEMGCLNGVEIYHTSDLPARSGVGSSSAFVVGLVQALAALDSTYWHLKGEHWTPHKLAQTATDIERFRCFETVGSQDQILCAFGGLNTIEFPPGEESKPVVTPLNYPKALELLNDRLLLFYTGIQRLASDVASGYVRELYQRPATMRRLVQMVEVGAMILRQVDTTGLSYFGHLLHEAWELKKSLGAGISTDKVNTLYDAGKKAGALGGKLLGAGGGGFLLFYVEPHLQESVRKAVILHGCQEVSFRFENAGSTLVYNGESCAA